ncbi:MAG TPA: hypothetical protein DEP53_20570 [Bacteroidetes bacterium]|nr:hypothetical protein [Bacteroidota bacterium]
MFLDLFSYLFGDPLARSTSQEYVEALTRSDMPLAKKVAQKAYCFLGQRECRKLGLEGKECAGECPIVKKEKARAKSGAAVRRLSSDVIDVDLPFNLSEEEAFDVDAALQKMKLRNYDLVLLDLRMPKRSGMEVLKSIRTQWPDIPVIMVTGHGTIETAIEATKLGAFNFLPKPFTPTELTAVVVEPLAA